MNAKTLLLGAAASIAIAGPASAAQGWYAGLEGGTNWVQKVDIDTGNTTFAVTDLSAHFNTGWALLGTVGYDFGTLRVEFEAGYRDNTISSFTTTGGFVATPTNADLDEVTLMGNVLFDVSLPPNFVLSFGAGLGADDVTLKAAGTSSASNWSFAYQGIAGLSYSLPGAPRWELTMTYRYLVVDDTTLTFPPTITTDNITKHTLTVGFRNDFAPPP